MTRTKLAASRRLWARRLKKRRERLRQAEAGKDGPRIAHWEKLEAEAYHMVHRRARQLAHVKEPLRARALKVAEGLVGVMEQGGNNAGPTVSKIIRANGGTGPEPWCGSFQAYCYRLAGSKVVQRAWASVRAFSGLTGVRRTTDPKAGDLVRFNFDHIGMFVRRRADGQIETIEGNTGSSGAVSDSKTGGDGVYRKTRSTGLVRDYLEVLR